MSKWTPPAEVKILGQTYKTSDYINQAGQRQTIPVRLLKSMVKKFEHNREELSSKLKHLRNLVNKNKENFRAFPVFLADENGIHHLYDAHHLFEVDSTREDEYITCYINWWVNPNDDKAKLEQVKKINADQTGWTLYNFLVSNSRVEGGDYTFLLNQSKKVKNANVAVSAYIGLGRVGADHPLKGEGFVMTDFQRTVGDFIMSKIEELQQNGYKPKKDIKSYTMREFNELLYKTAVDLGGVNEKYRNFANKVFDNIETLLNSGNFDMTKKPVIEFYSKLERKYLTSIKIAA